RPSEKLLFFHNILKLRSKCMCFPLQTVTFRGHFPKYMPFNYRKWNIVYSVFLYSSQFHKRFNLFISEALHRCLERKAATPGTGTAVARPIEVICRNAFMTNILLARGSSNARGKVDTVKVVSLNRCRPCTVIK